LANAIRQIPGLETELDAIKTPLNTNIIQNPDGSYNIGAADKAVNTVYASAVTVNGSSVATQSDVATATSSDIDSLFS